MSYLISHMHFQFNILKFTIPSKSKPSNALLTSLEFQYKRR